MAKKIIKKTTKKSTVKKTTATKRSAPKTKKFSSDAKLNAALTGIEKQLYSMLDTRSDSIQQIKSYNRDYPNEPDYMIAQHGSLLVYIDDIRKFYKKAGYNVSKMSDVELWNLYLKQVGIVVRLIIYK